MKLNIVFSADNNYAQHLTVAIFSLLQSSSNKDFYQINILDNNIHKENKAKITLSLKQFSNFEIKYIAVNQKLFEKTQNFLHLNQSTYFKLIIPSLFPKIDKILYLDCDVIIFDDLAKIYKSSIGGYCASAVMIFHPNYQSVIQKTYDLEPLSFCFNAGVLMLNLNQMRIRQTTQKALNFLNDHLNSMIGADQVINNIVLKSQCLPLDPRWNVQSYLFYAKSHRYCELSKSKFENIKKNPAIIHFDGAKPWSFGNKHPFRNKYFEILDKTAFSNWRPAFNFQQFLANSLFHYANALAKYLPEFLYHFFEQKYLSNNFLEKRYREIQKNKKI